MIISKDVTQFVKFVIVGVVNTAVDWIFTYGVLFLGANKYVAQGIGFLAGISNSYLLNKKWTFAYASTNKAPFWKFFLLGIFCFSVSAAILKILEVYPFAIQKIAATAIVTMLNFAGAKFLVFRN